MRAWIYLGAIALLTTLVVQNWQPLVSLRFLGQQTRRSPCRLACGGSPLRNRGGAVFTLANRRSASSAANPAIATP